MIPTGVSDKSTRPGNQKSIESSLTVSEMTRGSGTQQYSVSTTPTPERDYTVEIEDFDLGSYRLVEM